MSHQFDQTDMGILQLLQEDARLTHKELAHRLHKTVTPIHIRVRRLQEEGYIKRYAAILNQDKIGKSLTAFTQVQVKEHSQEGLMAFKNEIIKITEVMECYHMTGSFDFLLRIVIRDMKEYNDVLIHKLAKVKDIGHVESFFVISEIKHETAFSLNTKT